MKREGITCSGFRVGDRVRLTKSGEACRSVRVWRGKERPTDATVSGFSKNGREIYVIFDGHTTPQGWAKQFLMRILPMPFEVADFHIEEPKP